MCSSDLGPDISVTAPTSSSRLGRTFWGKNCDLGCRFGPEKCDLSQGLAKKCDLVDGGGSSASMD